MSARSPLPVSDEQIRVALSRRPDTEQMADDLDVIVATVERTRQRSRLLARWAAGGTRTRSVGVLLVVVALLLMLGVLVVAFVGSRHRLPPPFGVAKPGLIAFDLGGHLFVANPDGTGRQQITSGQVLDGRAKWSPDGTTIAYESRMADRSTALIAVDAAGRHPIVLADHLAIIGDLTWSPDSRRVAFGARLVGTEVAHIYIADADRPGAIELGGPDVNGWEPAWSPDGNQIVFKRIYPSLQPPSFADGAKGHQGGAPDALWLIGPDGSNLHRLTATTGAFDALWNTVWSPDGKRLAFLAAGLDGRFDVYVINADGTDERNISNSPEDEYWPSWSPDGTRIAFPRMSLTINNAGSLVVVDPDGSNPIVLKGPLVNSNAAVWSPDGTRLLGYGKNPDTSIDANSGIAVFDPSGRAPPILIPADNFGDASWQRLAP